jgi:hypothetical protein
MSRFVAQAPVRWRGRYGRVPGDSTVFHLRSLDGGYWPLVEWPQEDGETWTCPMVESPAATALAKAVKAGKQFHKSTGGGAFLINEFGQVIVPSPNERARALVGVWSGPLKFVDPDGDIFDLYDDEGLDPGDDWPWPYIGTRYNLSKFDEIYFWSDSDTEAGKELPAAQDGDLIDAVRDLRPRGAVRLMVGCGGVVLTKVSEGSGSRWDEDLWIPTYVGRVDFRKWFAKEG